MHCVLLQTGSLRLCLTDRQTTDHATSVAVGRIYTLRSAADRLLEVVSNRQTDRQTDRHKYTDHATSIHRVLLQTAAARSLRPLTDEMDMHDWALRPGHGRRDCRTCGQHARPSLRFSYGATLCWRGTATSLCLYV